MSSRKKLNLFLLGTLSCFTASVFAQSSDPWEPMNRNIYTVNSIIDKYTFKPLAQGYSFITPKLVQQGVHNFFQNIGDVKNLANSLLQAQPREAGTDIARLMLNTTLGIGGVIDVASRAGLQRHDQDFGLTLAHWGVGSGPYIVIPLLGPSTIRDATAIVADDYTQPYRYINHVPTRNTIHGVDLLDTRTALLPMEKMVTGDEYIFVRNSYLDSRDLKTNGAAIDDF